MLGVLDTRFIHYFFVYLCTFTFVFADIDDLAIRKQKRNSYEEEFKHKVISFEEENNSYATSRQFGVR